MKKVIFAVIMLLAVGGTTMAQTPAKKDSTSTSKKHTMKKTHKMKPAKTTKTAPAPQK